MTSEQPASTPDTSRATRRRPAWAVGSIAAAVLLAGGGTAYWASTAHGDGRAGDGAASAPRVAATPSGPGIAPGEPDPSGGGVTYTADVKLPDGPATAPAFSVGGEVSSADVARLAAALGLSGAPRQSGETWLVGEGADGSGPRLTVNRKAPGTWNFSRHQGGGGTGDDCVRGKDTCGPATLPQDNAGTAPGAAAGPAAGDPVSEEAARTAAGPVLAAVGQSGAKLDARLAQGAVRVVSADPVVGGLPTQGWSTKIGVGADSAVVSGSGELTAPVRASEQPVIGSVDALARLNDKAKGPSGGPRPDPSGCATSVPLSPDTPTGATDTLPCNPEPRPLKPPRTESVRGAALGLVPGEVGGARGLVPAWLFEVAGKDGGPGHTVAQPAALTAETGPTDAPASPVPPSKALTVPGYAYAEADRTLTVNFWGGVCSTYALEAREQPESVMVKITDTPNKPGQSCIMLAQEMTVTARLEQPLGDRKVVDATTGKPLPRQ
ncbi:membrane protein [Streptomyces avidinii]